MDAAALTHSLRAFAKSNVPRPAGIGVLAYRNRVGTALCNLCEADPTVDDLDVELAEIIEDMCPSQEYAVLKVAFPK